MQTVTTEYHRWRTYHKHRSFGESEDEFTKKQWDSMFMSSFHPQEGSKDDNALLSTEDEFFVDALFNSMQMDLSARTAVQAANASF